MAAVFRKLTPNRYRTSQWAGGTTTELLIWPEGASYENRDFLWRLSTARVQLTESDFTKLPGYERVLIPLSGSLEMKHGDEPAFLLERLRAHRFDGAVATKSRGCVTDFNLMIAKGLYQGDAEAVMLQAGEAVPLFCGVTASSCQNVQKVVYCFNGDVYLNSGRRRLPLAEKESILICEAPQEIRAEPRNGKPAVLVCAVMERMGGS